VSGRGRAGLPPLGWFLAGLAGSALVASLVGIPPSDTGTLLAVISLAALVVIAAGFGLQGRLRRRRAKVARQGALTAAVTAAVALAGLWAVSAQMLVSSHDLAVVLASLPVAAGAGVAYGVATARQVAADLEALARTARRLEAGDLDARAQVQGTAEVALIAETLNAAAARLAEARERERRMEQERRDLIAWASHDLRTPLASLRALAEALADDLAPDEATRRRYLASLTANVERLSGLVDDLFELSAIQAGAVTLQLEPTSLPDLATEVLDRFAPEAAAAGVQLTCRADGGGPVLAGRDQLGRVLANLVVNGIRHTPAAVACGWTSPTVTAPPSSESPTAAAASPRPTCPASSTSCGGATQHARPRAPASGWPSPVA
jgi:signal transduction histidine kinase